MATVQCSKCSAERKGFRRELDSWRHKLIHCVGFESILEGIYGPLLLRDLNLFDDCEPEELDDWSSDANFSQCSFCNLPLDKNDQVPGATSPLSSPSEYSPCQAPTLSEGNQSAYRFLQAVFHKKDVPITCDSGIPLIAQELMKKMIHQFAKEYASKCLLHTTTNGVTTKTSSPLSETSDAPLDLTVSRNLEERESKCEPDGVLDLSKGSSASSSNHKASGSLLPSFSEEMGDLGQRGTKRFRSSVLGAVLGSLCPSHSSLLYQILKLAHREHLLSDVNHRPVGQTQSICCHCGVNPHDNNLNAVPSSECKAHNSSLYNSSINWEHQDPESTCHSGDSKSNCSISHFTLPGCKRQPSLCSSCGCLQSCKMETYTVLCPKRLHCTSCHSPTAGHINNKVCSFASPPLLNSPSPGSCALICCNQHNPHSCPCYTNHASLTQDRTTEKEGDPPCPVLKREQSPSPPPLSPILSDVEKNDEKPPSLLHHKQERADQMLKNGHVNSSHEGSAETTTDEDQECQSSGGSPDEQNSSGNLLQDVVSRFSEKLETIKPIEKDRPLVSTAVEKEKQHSPITSQNLQFHAHMTEIITTVLHTGRASDYNLSELFNRHDSKDPKSPNTRSRRRQEVLAAMATPTDNASARRQTLQIKRDLAMFDQSHSKKKVPVAKRPKLKDENVTTLQTANWNVINEESKRNTGKSELLQAHKIENSQLNISTTESNVEKLKEQMQTVIVTDKVKTCKAEEKAGDVSALEKDLTFSGNQILNPELSGEYSKQGSSDDYEQTKAIPATMTSVKQRGRPCKKIRRKARAARERKHKEALSEHKSDSNGRLGKQKDAYTPFRQQKVCQPHHSKEARRSRRNIVPPHRFSSYVTEPRKMFFVACFSENIFNLKTRKNEDLKASQVDALPKDPDPKDIQFESRKETPEPSPDHTPKRCVRSKKSKCLSAISVSPQNAHKEKPPTKDLKDSEDVAAKPFGRLRSSPKRHDQATVSAAQETQSNSTITPTQAERPLNSQVEYTSPIKLMFVSPVTDEEGVRYSLKSAGSNSSGQEEAFDPCVESSWAGVPQKHKGIQLGTSKGKRTSSPLKSATSPAKSASSPSKSPCSPPKSATSPKSASSPQKSKASPSKSTCSSPKSDKLPKSVSSPPRTATQTFKSSPSPAKATSLPIKAGSSPKSVSSSPKIVLRRSCEGTPTKRAASTESQRSPDNPLAYHETTPPKRRPGRPKKLGPQLEQKVKRPIGRPRKEKGGDSATGTKMENGTSASSPNSEKKENKNLKITVVYGRSRRNKRTVSEGFDQLQTELHNAWQAVGVKSDISIIMSDCKTSSGRIQTASTESSEKLNFVNPLKQCAPQSSSKVKCQKQDDSITTRKPGRPAKVKISGISVTVTTVSPRKRKIQINKDARQSPKKFKKVLKPEIKFAKETWTINQLTSKISHTEEKMDTKNDSHDAPPNQCVAVRQSMRVRKPSVHFLHAVATSTSRSYSHSNALLRRSKQFLLNKANNERRQGEQQSSVQVSGEKRKLFGQARNNLSKDLTRVAALSVNSIFTPTETLRWWPASAEEKTMDQELARRIRLISDTWVSDTDENQEKDVAFCSKIATKSNSSSTRKSQCSSLVRTLFDCPPNKPRSCSMQQLCSWFMQTTETRSLAIVKKASSRNPYEVMHFPRSTNKKSISHSPQAERLRKHIKKFAKVMPKSPLQHQRAQKRMRNKTPPSTHKTRRQLFSPSPVKGRFSQGEQRSCKKSFGKYQAALSRAKTRFLSQERRKKWQESKKNLKRATPCQNGHVVSKIQPRSCPSRRAARTLSTDCLRKSSATSSVEQTQESTDEQKEQNLCSKAWSPETLKECRVFLRKINSPDNELPEEEGDSCTVTLDDGSPSVYHFSRRQKELVEVVKAVKTESKRNSSRSASRDFSLSAPKSVQEKSEKSTGRQNGRYKCSGALSEEQPPPPAKKLRQSRMRGLTGPRWCDFVFET